MMTDTATRPPEPDTTTLLTPKELAAYLRVSERTVKRLRDRREITYSMVSGRPRFEPADVAAYLKRNKVRTLILGDVA